MLNKRQLCGKKFNIFTFQEMPSTSAGHNGNDKDKASSSHSQPVSADADTVFALADLSAMLAADSNYSGVSHRRNTG
jgi:hypothetical protein